MATLRIVLCSDTWLPQVNGVSRTLDRLARHLLDRGHELALVTPRPGDAMEDAPSPGPGVRVHIRRPGHPLPVYPDLLVTLPLDRSSRRSLDDFRPHVVHCATESVLGWSVRTRHFHPGHGDSAWRRAMAGLEVGLVLVGDGPLGPDHRTGFRVRSGDAEALADALLRLALDPGLRGFMGTVGRMDALKRSWSTVLDGVIDVYEEAA